MNQPGGLAGRLQGRRGTAPDTPREVVLVIRPDAELSAAAFTAAVKAGGNGVAVVTTLQIHGYGFGLPNPGLMPNAKERAAATAAVGETVRRLEQRRIPADGQIVVTRKAAKAIAGIAKRRGTAAVLLDRKNASRLRRAVEGDLVRQLERRLGRGSVRVFASPFD